MPGCVLRVRANEPPLSGDVAKSHTKTGFIYEVGTADGDDFKRQVTEAESFLARHSAALIAAAKTENFGAQLDFGVWNGAPDVFAQSFTFPPSLAALASACGIDLTLSIYLASDP